MKNIKKEVNKAIRHTSFPNSNRANKNVSAWVTPAVRDVYYEVAKKDYHVSPSTLSRVLIESLIKREISINPRTTPSELDKSIIANINDNAMPSEEDIAINEAAKAMDKAINEAEALFPVEEDKYPSARDFILAPASREMQGIGTVYDAETYNIVEIVMSQDTSKVFSSALYKNEDYYNTSVPVNTVYFNPDGSVFISIKGKHDTLYLDKNTETVLRETYGISRSEKAGKPIQSGTVFSASLMKTTEVFCVGLVEKNTINLKCS